jgi:hypothetical protein
VKRQLAFAAANALQENGRPAQRPALPPAKHEAFYRILKISTSPIPVPPFFPATIAV